jgi:hypothetical protein
MLNSLSRVGSHVEPREFWDRNTVLAEAFCASDERVRQAQAVLDEAQAERSRTLAAFAVTVGSDGTIADLMGLNEREVRLARRTVGKSDARTVAEGLLERYPGVHPGPGAHANKQAAPPPYPHQAQHQAQHQGAQAGPPPEENLADQAPLMEVHLPHPRGETVYSLPDAPAHPVHDPAPPVLGAQEAEHNTVVWSSSMDSVLLWSWQSGLDLQTVAAELGLDIRALLMRVQALADNGMLTPSAQTAEANRSGRHRRHHEEAYAALFSPTATFPTHVHH